jgi:flagellar hook-associated protein 2
MFSFMAAISFSGLASGIDSQSFIASLIRAQRKATVDPIERQVQSLTDTNDSFSEVKKRLKNLQEKADLFRTVQGGSIEKQVASSQASVITAYTAKDAALGSTDITVDQLARGGTSSFGDRFSSSSQAINSAINNSSSANDRTVSVTIGSGSEQETIAVTLDNTTTADQFIEQFNAQSSRAEASLVNIGTSAAPSYALMIRALNTGTDKGSISITTGSEIQSAGSGAFKDASRTDISAQNASLSISGISGTITRSTNTVSDLLAGITLNLTATGTTSITVTTDNDATKKKLSDFVSAFNDIVTYTQEQNAITQDTTSDPLNPKMIFGSLSQTRIDDQALSQIRSVFRGAALSGQAVNSLADIGITTERDGTLKFNETTFASAFATDSSSLGTVLTTVADQLAGVDGTVAQYTRFGGLIDGAVQQGTAAITTGNARISDIENRLAKQADSMTAQFARLESLMGRLNQQSQVLTAILPR